jgi:hypothetical protein
MLHIRLTFIFLCVLICAVAEVSHAGGGMYPGVQGLDAEKKEDPAKHEEIPKYKYQEVKPDPAIANAHNPGNEDVYAELEKVKADADKITKKRQEKMTGGLNKLLNKNSADESAETKEPPQSFWEKVKSNTSQMVETTKTYWRSKFDQK